MQRELRQTADGSHTLALAGTDITYHSHHGAIAESRHVFIEAGLKPFLAGTLTGPVNILEIGFGTGLNALLSLQEAQCRQRMIHYLSIEPHPVTPEETAILNYGKLLNRQQDFLSLHNAEWDKDIILDPFFTLHKKQISLLDLNGIPDIHCLYFDAFSPVHQPELWTEAVFRKLYEMMAEGGLLVTYCSKSVIRRAMTAAGFRVEKIPGPWGKREMVRARKGD